MGTIAWDGKTLAGDSCVIVGGAVCHAQRIRRCKNGSLVGAVGSASACELFMLWLDEGNASDRPDFQLDDGDFCDALEIAKDGRVFRHGNYTPYRILDTQVAIGSGAAFAKGAMAMGAYADRAVLIACEYDPDSSGPVHTLLLDPA